MNINLELYKIFYTVVKNGNITKASKELLISQPAISKSIKKLESSLGGQLFIRSKNGVVLTEEGKAFYNYIKNAMEYINNAEHKFSDLMKLEDGTIKIGANTSITKEILIKYLEIFHNLYPKVAIEIITGTSEELISKLKNGLIDLAVIVTPINIPKDIEVKKIKDLHDIFVCGKKYFDLTKENLCLKDLKKYPLVLQSKESSTRQRLDKFFQDNGVELTPYINLGNYTLTKEFIKYGFGIGVITKEFALEDIENKSLFELNIKENLPVKSIAIIYSNKNLPNFSTRKLIETILENKNNI